VADGGRRGRSAARRGRRRGRRGPPVSAGSDNPSGVPGTPATFGPGQGRAGPGETPGGTEARTLREGDEPRHRGGGATRETVRPDEPRSYYGQPVLAEVAWEPAIAAYFFLGGMAGASAPLAFAAELTGNTALARRARLVALAGLGGSLPLLISDLGRPERFYRMLRVFKVTSPMSVGTWILSVTGAAVALGTARDVLGWFESLGRAGDAAAAALGPALSTYTAVLIADTAVPVWHLGRRELPWIFAGSSAASAGGAAAVVTAAEDAGPARWLATGGAVVEVVAAQRYEHRLGELSAPLKQGTTGRLSRLAKALSLGGAAALAAGGRRRGVAAAGGLALLTASALERYTIYDAGRASAADPAHTVGPQRARVDRGEPATRRPA